VAEAIQVARTATRPGGEVVAADIDVNRLLDGPSQRYPSRLLYLDTEAKSRLVASSAPLGLLASSAVGSRLVEVESLVYDDVLGEYGDATELWSGIERRGWRGAAWVASDVARSLFQRVAESLDPPPAGWTTDREPWLAVIGKVP
jgi:hypothetical protein